MFLIAESGATKTDWILISKTQEIAIQTIGFNPYYQNSDSIIKTLQTELLPFLNENPTQIFYFGAGCATNEKQKVVEMALQNLFSNANISVASDMLGAAIGLCGNQNGMVGILGTGSNLCLYENQQITQTTPSTGIWLGDEGSGGQMGKNLIINYLNDDLPIDLKHLFEQTFSERYTEILENVYNKPYPNRYLASFTKFVVQHKSHFFCQRLIQNAFSDFVEKRIKKIRHYQTYPLNLTGSVAYHFQTEIEQICQQSDIQLGKIVAAPIQSLVKYYQTLL